MVFCSGPAGTGKTHIAVVSGVLALVHQQVDRIVIARPLVQAGEDTGFLPGDIKAKADPYMRPIYDEMKIYMDNTTLVRMQNDNTIEVLPFAYMRGRTFRKTFIIADECQNASFAQLKMLTTRVGTDSVMVLTGDSSQSDLPPTLQGGFQDVQRKLSHINFVQCITLTKNDIVRDPLVEQIIEALEENNVKEASQESPSS
jgi:phosphate starvation-inducible PhoH-like protein